MFQSSVFSAEGKCERDKRRKKQRQPVEMENGRINRMKQEYTWWKKSGDADNVLSALHNLSPSFLDTF